MWYRRLPVLGPQRTHAIDDDYDDGDDDDVDDGDDDDNTKITPHTRTGTDNNLYMCTSTDV